MKRYSVYGVIGGSIHRLDFDIKDSLIGGEIVCKRDCPVNLEEGLVVVEVRTGKIIDNASITAQANLVFKSTNLYSIIFPFESRKVC